MTLQQKIHHSNQIANAIQRHEDEYATLELRHAISLPTPPTCGTMSQQRSYAMGKAMDLVDKYEKEKQTLDFERAALGSDDIFGKVFNTRS